MSDAPDPMTVMLQAVTALVQQQAEHAPQRVADGLCASIGVAADDKISGVRWRAPDGRAVYLLAAQVQAGLVLLSTVDEHRVAGVWLVHPAAVVVELVSVPADHPLADALRNARCALP